LWAKSLRFEYLEEKLGQIAKANKKDNGVAALAIPPSKAATNTLAAASTNSIPEILAKRYQRILRTWKELGPEDVFELYLTSLTMLMIPIRTISGLPPRRTSGLP